MNKIIKYEDVESKILVIRGEQILLDRDVAILYGVETREINQAVSRNRDKFPTGYVFTLNSEEKSELVTNCDRFEKLKHSTVAPTAITERGLYMLATIIKSPIATQTTIAIIEAFINIRDMNRIGKQLMNLEDEEKLSTLVKKFGNTYIKLFDDDLMEVKGDESGFEVNLPFFKFKHAIKREKRKV